MSDVSRHRILFVQGGAERAGAERVLMSLLRHIDRERFEPVVVFYAEGPFVAEVEAAGVRTLHRHPAGRLRDIVRVPAVVADLTRVIDEVEPDLVQATGEKMSVIAGWAARRRRIPCIFWLHDSPWSRDTGGPATLATQVAMAASPRTSVVSCAHWLSDAFARRYRMPGIAIPNGIEWDRLPSTEDAEAARGALEAQTGWGPDEVILGHFARLQRWKGTDVFLEAGARACARHGNLRLLVVGGAMFGQDEQWAAGLPQRAVDLGLGDHVHFTGYRPDALALMAAVDGVVHCSIRPDPFPTVVLEGMCLGRAVVASRVNGPEEAIDPGRNGLLVAPRDATALAAALSELAGSASRRRALGDAARTDARDRFDADRMARDFENHWTSLIVAGAS